MSSLEGSEGEGESGRRGDGRGLGGMTTIPGAHAQVSFSPSSLRHSSQCLFRREGGSWYSSWGDEEVDTDSLNVSPSLDDDELEEPDRTASSVGRQCNVLLFLLTSYNVDDQRSINVNGGEGDSETETRTEREGERSKGG